MKWKEGTIDMRVFAKTDMGRAREVNQDFYHVSSDLPGVKLCILADRHGRI
ncbi:MAG: hypothetical protein FWC79_02855 [Oscillospiraceae bacterium]|nr:hypothetical protein [Oscillospiraceae bacterium]